MSELFTKDAFLRLDGYSPAGVSGGFARAIRVDGRDMIDVAMNFTLPGDYLRKVDVMSMAHGLEVRVPFLGRRCLELAATFRIG